MTRPFQQNAQRQYHRHPIADPRGAAFFGTAATQEFNRLRSDRLAFALTNATAHFAFGAMRAAIPAITLNNGFPFDRRFALAFSGKHGWPNVDKMRILA